MGRGILHKKALLVKRGTASAIEHVEAKAEGAAAAVDETLERFAADEAATIERVREHFKAKAAAHRAEQAARAAAAEAERIAGPQPEPPEVGQADREKLKAELRAEILAELHGVLGHKPTQPESEDGTKEAAPAAAEKRPVSEAPVA